MLPNPTETQTDASCRSCCRVSRDSGTPRPASGPYAELVDNNLDLVEHDQIVTEAQGFAAGRGHIPKNEFFCYDTGKFFLVGRVGHFRVEFGKNCDTLVILRMIGIIDPLHGLQTLPCSD